MNFESLIGYAATILISIAFLPQVYKVWKTKSVEDISLPTFILLMGSTALWMTYAGMRSDIPLLITNIILGINQGSILLCKILYGKK